MFIKLLLIINFLTIVFVESQFNDTFTILQEVPTTIDVEAFGASNYETLSKVISSYFYRVGSVNPHVFCAELSTTSSACYLNGNVKFCPVCAGYSTFHPAIRTTVQLDSSARSIDDTYYFPIGRTESSIAITDFLINDTDSKWPWSHTLPNPTTIYGKIIRERYSMTLSQVISHIGHGNLPVRVVIGDYEVKDFQKFLDAIYIAKPESKDRALALVNRYRPDQYFTNPMRIFWASRIVYSALHRPDHVDVFMPVFIRYLLYYAKPTVRTDLVTHLLEPEYYVASRGDEELKAYANSVQFLLRYKKYVLRCPFPSRPYRTQRTVRHTHYKVSKTLTINKFNLDLSRILVTYKYPNNDRYVGQLETSLNSEDDLDHLLHLLLRLTGKYEGYQYYIPVEKTLKTLPFTHRAEFYDKILQECMRFSLLTSEFIKDSRTYLDGTNGNYFMRTFLPPETYADYLVGDKRVRLHSLLFKRYFTEQIPCE